MYLRTSKLELFELFMPLNDTSAPVGLGRVTYPLTYVPLQRVLPVVSYSSCGRYCQP